MAFLTEQYSWVIIDGEWIKHYYLTDQALDLINFIIQFAVGALSIISGLLVLLIVITFFKS